MKLSDISIEYAHACITAVLKVKNVDYISFKISSEHSKGLPEEEVGYSFYMLLRQPDARFGESTEFHYGNALFKSLQELVLNICTYPSLYSDLYETLRSLRNRKEKA